MGGDTARRRALDSVIDRLSVVCAFAVAATHDGRFAVAAVGVSVVNAPAAILAARTMFESNVVLKAPAWHKSWSLICFAAGLAYVGGYLLVAATLAYVGTLLMAICTGLLLHSHHAYRREFIGGPVDETAAG
jgi:phosphatidylglycerophosphate synthase